MNWPILAALAVSLGTLARADVPEQLIGADLSNWVVVAKPPGDGSKTWSIDDGILKSTGKPTGCLLTRAEYENYTLTLEYRYPPTAAKRPNTGVLGCSGRTPTKCNSPGARLATSGCNRTPPRTTPS